MNDHRHEQYMEKKLKQKVGKHYPLEEMEPLERNSLKDTSRGSEAHPDLGPAPLPGSGVAGGSHGEKISAGIGSAGQVPTLNPSAVHGRSYTDHTFSKSSGSPTPDTPGDRYAAQ